jgi:hypothetical protein
VCSEFGAQVCSHAAMHQAYDPSVALGADPNAFNAKAGEGAKAVEVDFRVEVVKIFSDATHKGAHAKTHFLDF